MSASRAELPTLALEPRHEPTPVGKPPAIAADGPYDVGSARAALERVRSAVSRGLRLLPFASRPPSAFGLLYPIPSMPSDLFSTRRSRAACRRSNRAEGSAGCAVSAPTIYLCRALPIAMMAPPASGRLRRPSSCATPCPSPCGLRQPAGCLRPDHPCALRRGQRHGLRQPAAVSARPGDLSPAEPIFMWLHAARLATPIILIPSESDVMGSAPPSLRPTICRYSARATSSGSLRSPVLRSAS